MKRRIKYKRLADWSSYQIPRSKKSFRFKLQQEANEHATRIMKRKLSNQNPSFNLVNYTQPINRNPVISSASLTLFLTLLLLNCCTALVLSTISSSAVSQLPKTSNYTSTSAEKTSNQRIDVVAVDPMEISESRLIAALTTNPNGANKPTDAIRKLLARPRFSLVSFVPNLLSKQMVLKRPEVAINLRRLRNRLHPNGHSTTTSELLDEQQSQAQKVQLHTLMAPQFETRNHNLGYRLPIFAPSHEFSAVNMQPQTHMTATFVPSQGQGPVLMSLKSQAHLRPPPIPLRQHQPEAQQIVLVHEAPPRPLELQETEKHLDQIDQEIKSEYESRLNLHDHIVANESLRFEGPAPMGVFVAPAPRHESSAKLEQPPSSTTIEPPQEQVDGTYDDDDDDNEDDSNQEREQEERHEQPRDGGDQTTTASLLQASEDSEWQPTDYPPVRGHTGGRFAVLTGSRKSSEKPRKKLNSAKLEDKGVRQHQQQIHQQQQQQVPFVPTPAETIAQLRLNGTKVASYNSEGSQPFNLQQSSEVVSSSVMLANASDDNDSDKPTTRIPNNSQPTDERGSNLIQNQDQASKLLLLPSHQTSSGVSNGATNNRFSGSLLMVPTASSGIVKQQHIIEPLISQVTANQSPSPSPSISPIGGEFSVEPMAADGQKTQQPHQQPAEEGNFHPTTGSLSETLRKLRATRARIKQLQAELNATQASAGSSSPWTTSATTFPSRVSPKSQQVDEARDGEELDEKLPVKGGAVRKETTTTITGQRGADWFRSWAPPPLSDEQPPALPASFRGKYYGAQQVKAQQTMGMPMGMYHNGPLTSPARLVASAFGRAAHNALSTTNQQRAGNGGPSNNRLPLQPHHQQVSGAAGTSWQHPSPAPILLSSTITVADDQQVTTVQPLDQRNFRLRPSTNSSSGSIMSGQQVVAHPHHYHQQQQQQQQHASSKWISSHKHQRGDERFKVKLASSLAGNPVAAGETNNSQSNSMNRTKYASELGDGHVNVAATTTTTAPRPPSTLSHQQVDGNIEILSTGDENNGNQSDSNNEQEEGEEAEDSGGGDDRKESDSNSNRKVEHQRVITKSQTQKSLKLSNDTTILAGSVSGGGGGNQMQPSGGHYVGMATATTPTLASGGGGKPPKRLELGNNQTAPIETSTQTTRNDAGNSMSQLFHKLLDSIYSVSGLRSGKSSLSNANATSADQLSSQQRGLTATPTTSHKLTTERVLHTVIVFSCLFALVCLIVVYTSFRCQRGGGGIAETITQPKSHLGQLGYLHSHHHHHLLRRLGSRKYCSSNSSGALIGAVATSGSTTQAPLSHSSSCDRLILDGTMRNVSLLARHLHVPSPGNNNNNSQQQHQIYSAPMSQRQNCCHCFSCSAANNDIYQQAQPQRRLPFGAASSVNKITNQEARINTSQQVFSHNTTAQLLQRVPVGGTRMRMMSSAEDAAKLSPRFCYGTESEEDETTCCQCRAHGNLTSGSATITKKQRSVAQLAAAPFDAQGNEDRNRVAAIKTAVDMRSTEDKNNNNNNQRHQDDEGIVVAGGCECNKCHHHHHHHITGSNDLNNHNHNDDSHNSGYGCGRSHEDQELGLSKSINTPTKSAKQQQQHPNRKLRAKSSQIGGLLGAAPVGSVIAEETTTAAAAAAAGSDSETEQSPSQRPRRARGLRSANVLSGRSPREAPTGSQVNSDNSNCNLVKRSPANRQAEPDTSQKFKVWSASPLPLLAASIRKGFSRKIIGANMGKSKEQQHHQAQTTGNSCS